MARVFFNNSGGVNQLSGANATINVVTFPANTATVTGLLMLVNDSDSAVVGQINANSSVQLGVQSFDRQTGEPIINLDDAGEDLPFRLDAKSYMILDYSVVTGGGQGQRRVDISTSHMFTAHRTAANSGEHVYLSIIQ